jgi:hypothetical protein
MRAVPTNNRLSGSAAHQCTGRLSECADLLCHHAVCFKHCGRATVRNFADPQPDDSLRLHSEQHQLEWQFQEVQKHSALQAKFRKQGCEIGGERLRTL